MKTKILVMLGVGVGLFAAMLVWDEFSHTSGNSAGTGNASKDAACCDEALPVNSPLSENSVYHLRAEWRNCNGKSVVLRDLSGNVQIMAMIFTHCAYACPRILLDMQGIADALPRRYKNSVRYTLISFDTERDTPEVLRNYAREQALDLRYWTLLHGGESAVRELAMVLGVQYNKMDDGTFAHSNRISVLDEAGNLLYQEDGLGIDPTKIVQSISTHLRGRTQHIVVH